MTMLQGLDNIPGATEQQWRAARLQIVNWGGFHGYAEMEISDDVTVITGSSGAGKSTILDAYTALMMPANVVFNGASNDSGGGRARNSEQRNVLSYVRGKVDNTHHDGEVVAKVMRGQNAPTWSAVAMTFVNDDGDYFTALRAYFAGAHAVTSGDVSMRMFTLPDGIELWELEDFAQVGEYHFPHRQMKQKWPQISSYDSYATFSQALFTKLGIGRTGDGSKALTLLARIQASETIKSVDSLYKQLVIEAPSSYVKADKAIEHFDVLDDVYQTMIMAQERSEHLGPITNLHAKLESAKQAIEDNDELGDIASDQTPAGLWRLRLHRDILEREVDDNRSAARETKDRLTQISSSERTLVSQLEAARSEHAEQGGDLLIQLGSKIEEVEVTIADREARRAALIAATPSLDLQLHTREQFETAVREGNAFISGSTQVEEDLNMKRESMLRKQFPHEERLTEIRNELRSLENRAGRIDSYLHELREIAAKASGLSVTDLPFVAELIDVAPDESHWRTAIETALFSSARLMLVPQEHFDRFSAAIDPLKLRSRLNFEGVSRTVTHGYVELNPTKIAGKLLFKDSPYQSWVKQHITHPSRNALTVETTSELDGGGYRITAAGQTRKGNRGSHGRPSDRNVIGFDNEDLRAELNEEKLHVEAELKKLTGEADQYRIQLAALRVKRAAYERLIHEQWSYIDLQSAIDEKNALVSRRDDLRKNNDRLAALDLQITQLTQELDEVRSERYRLQRQEKELGDQHEKLVEQQDIVHPLLESLEMDEGITLRDELAQDLTQRWVNIHGEEQVTSANFNRLLTRLKQDLVRQAQDANADVSQATSDLERIFRNYLSRWPDANLGSTVEFYEDYDKILTEINASGLSERRNEWRRRLLEWSGEYLQELWASTNSAVEDIENRLDPINQILKGLSFGATNDRLVIDMQRLAPDYVVRFRQELMTHARMATKGLPDEELQKKFKTLQGFIAQIRLKTDPRLPRVLVNAVDRDRLLDVRRHVKITARQVSESGDPIAHFDGLQGKSGGEMQELIAFIVGSALRFQLGDQSRTKPRFAPVFLDEGFIKADGQFTERAVGAWRGLGFQLIVGVPIDKAAALERHGDVTVITKDHTSNRSYVRQLIREEKDAVLV